MRESTETPGFTKHRLQDKAQAAETMLPLRSSEVAKEKRQARGPNGDEGEVPDQLFPAARARAFRQDYAETLRHWAKRFDDGIDEAIQLAGAERVRVWRVYLRAARRGFETGFTSVYQVLCTPS